MQSAMYVCRRSAHACSMSVGSGRAAAAAHSCHIQALAALQSQVPVVAYQAGCHPVRHSETYITRRSSGSHAASDHLTPHTARWLTGLNDHTGSTIKVDLSIMMRRADAFAALHGGWAISSIENSQSMRSHPNPILPLTMHDLAPGGWIGVELQGPGRHHPTRRWCRLRPLPQARPACPLHHGGLLHGVDGSNAVY